jgi:hypothetical protein
MVRDRERLSSVLDSEPQNSITLAKIFKNVFINCNNAGLCYRLLTALHQNLCGRGRKDNVGVQTVVTR